MLFLGLVLIIGLKYFLNFLLKGFIVFPTAVINDKNLQSTSTLFPKPPEKIFYRPKNLLSFIFIEHQILIYIGTAVSGIINKEEDVSDIVFGVTIFDEIWLLFLGINISLQKGFLYVVQFVLNSKNK